MRVKKTSNIVNFSIVESYPAVHALLCFANDEDDIKGKLGDMVKNVLDI